MNDLITDLLTYSKILDEPIKQDLVDLNRIIETVVSNLSTEIEKRKVKIVYTNLSSIKANESLMISLFQNLIQNGIKFNKAPKPEIIIDSHVENEFLILSVKDNGIGIKDEHKPSIFTIFRRFKSDNEYPGTGIGLALCKKVVDQYDGQIWVDSTRGIGWTFFIKLPL